MEKKVTRLEHPLILHKLSIMRDEQTTMTNFRRLCYEISMLMGYEVTRTLPLEKKSTKTPLATFDAPYLKDNDIVLVSILRAGNALLEGMLTLLPTAHVGHVGLYRDPKTLVAVEYYFKLPNEVKDKTMIVLDPMLATGHSAMAAVSRLKLTNPKDIKFMCLLASPQGIENFHQEHPDVEIVTASVDEGLNDKGYILPGLGDAGDRFYGTK